MNLAVPKRFGCMQYSTEVEKNSEFTEACDRTAGNKSTYHQTPSTNARESI